MITIIFGPPGSGKGTQAKYVSELLSVPHVSTGEILRREIAAGTELGKAVAPIMSSGALVSDELMVKVLESRLSQPDAARGALLDGFPRTVAQAEALLAMLKARGWNIASVISLDVKDEELKKRILRRGAEEGRSDDNAEAFEKRMEEYRQGTAPVLDYFAKAGVWVTTINGVGPVETITQRIAGIVGATRDGMAS